MQRREKERMRAGGRAEKGQRRVIRVQLAFGLASVPCQGHYGGNKELGRWNAKGGEKHMPYEGRKK